MDTIQKSDPIPIPKKKEKQNFNLLGDNNFFSPFSPPSINDNIFRKLLKYKISPSSFKKYSLSGK